MKIIQLNSENVKRLIAVEIKPDGNLVQITGSNGAGKTSVLDSIWWALCGSRNIETTPIRKGMESGKIRLDLGEIVVTRTFKRDRDKDGFTTKLEVTGNVKGSPQAMLDSLLDSLAFDPLAFARMDSRQQFDALKRFVPGLDFDKIAADNSIDYQSRTEMNRRAKEERTLADQIQIPDDAPVDRIDESALVAKLAEAGKHNAGIQVRENNRKAMSTTIASLREDAARKRREADSLEADANRMTEKLAAAGPLPAPIDVAELQAHIADARRHNETVDLQKTKAAHESLESKYRDESTRLTRQMEDRELFKRQSVAAAKLPVPTISFGDGTVLLDGVPFEQGSDAEKLRASCALAMAGNPKLRVLRVRDGSLLDSRSLALLAEMANERDFQVWIESATDGEPIGFVIENGMVKEAVSE